MPFTFLTIDFPKPIPDSLADDFSQLTRSIPMKKGFVTWTEIYVHAGSIADDGWKYLLSLAIEIYSYCRVKSEDMKPRGALLYREGNWGTESLIRLVDEFEDSFYEVYDLMSSGYLAVQNELLEEVFKAEPRSRKAAKVVLGSFTEAFPSMSGIDFWEVLADTDAQDEILLASNLSIPIAVSFSDRIKELIFEISQDPAVLRTLNWRRVEELVAGLIEDKGYEVQLTARTRDGGRDIIALKGKGELLADEKYLIEVKHPESEHPVSVATVRELVGVGTVESSTGLVLVSTTRFTRDAVELAAREALRYRLSLKDYKDLMDWVEEYCKKRG